MTNQAHVRLARSSDRAWLMVQRVAGVGSATGDSKTVNRTSSSPWLRRLTGSKPGGMVAGVIITIFGAWLITHFVTLPGGLGLSIEGVPIIAALLGAIIVAVFYVLIRKQFGGK